MRISDWSSDVCSSDLLYRVISYAGALTDNGLALGTMPVGSTPFVQTAIANQVNLVNTAGLTLNFWDGAGGPKFDGAVNGGDGVWQNSTGNDNWADIDGIVNATYADGTRTEERRGGNGCVSTCSSRW